MSGGSVTLFLGGDVMPGRGVDQILRHPGDPTLWESSVRDARRYVELAEAVNGPIPRPVDYVWPWGDALAVLDRFAPAVRLVNLETSVTRSADVAAGKAVNYRMSPDNVPVLTAARLDACALANNHVLDFGPAGLAETLDTLDSAGIAVTGAGRDATEAARPAVLPIGRNGDGRVVVFSFGTPSSGVPPSWAATADGAGVAVLPDLSERTAAVIGDRVTRGRQPGDIVVVSLHWGPNWGYAVTPAEVGFAHRLVDAGVDLVHGHSSHHPRPVEVYRERLVLYGCGDLVDDYEGIAGYGRYRDDLRLLYLPRLEAGTGRLLDLRMVPMQAHRMRLRPAVPLDREWLHRTLYRVSRGYGTKISLDPDGLLGLAVEA